MDKTTYFAALVDGDGHPVGPRVPAPIRVRYGNSVASAILTGSLDLEADEAASRWALFDSSGNLLTLADEAPLPGGSWVLFLLRPGRRRRELRQDVRATLSHVPWATGIIALVFAGIHFVGWWNPPSWVEVAVVFAYTVIASSTIVTIRPFWRGFLCGYGWPIYWTVLVVRALRDRS